MVYIVIRKECTMASETRERMPAIERLIPLHQHETALLMGLAGRNGRGQLSLAFGTGGVALQADQSPWAVPLIREWRGQIFNDGAGI
jgi:hypothetical protein